MSIDISYNFQLRGASDPLGDIHLFLKLAQATQISPLSKLSFISASTGKQCGEVYFSFCLIGLENQSLTLVG
jgi:hypothetical protein